MKLLIRDYLASLKEREELDAILPDLLSELGFTVYSRPRRGTLQRGVDIAAVGEDNDGDRKIFLFSVKQGDLTRQDWDGTPQALRSSLNEIRDVYVRNRIPVKYKDLKVVICLAFGGDVHEQVRESLTGYIAENTTERISFDEWNGDKIAGLLLKGILREEILPKPMRSSFQKAVAMIDEPDIAYQHFARLTHDLREFGETSGKARVRAARQLNICLWILFVWARDIDNLEAPYRASELVLLNVWELLRPTIDRKNHEAKALNTVLQQLIELHLNISSEFLERKVLPYAQVRHGFSMSIRTQASLDVNLALFEALGRISLTGLWIYWLGQHGDQMNKDAAHARVVHLIQAGLALINNNPSMFLPVCDRQATDVALFLQLWLASELDPVGISSWLQEMAGRLIFTIHIRGRYPTSSSDYRELVDHPRDRSDEYFKEATAGSTLIPLIAAWLQALGHGDTVEALSTLIREDLAHCTLQLWTPDASSESQLYLGDNIHGCALSDIPLAEGGAQLLATISEGARKSTGFKDLSPIKTNFWPILLVACRHHQLPVPPGFWIESLIPQNR
ncbi:chemotaxis protein [Geomonas terrae]|uniref:Chemotaxis protein n=1 Tax=Geomonas terrae TaxID=2562681 RepID=A0A4S1CLF6_9BACT|nr:chemotaxis protein [Geomonas terrae]TGU74585.1 chemotaxis protein [Geomonas terrae]